MDVVTPKVVVDIMSVEYKQELEVLSQGCPTANILDKEKKPRRHENQAVHVISQIYNASHPVKRYENERALKQNLLNPTVAAVHILAQYVEDYHYARRVAATVNATHKVIMGVHLDRRLNYSDAFGYANTHLPGRYVSIQHADTFLDESIDDAYFFDLFLEQPRTALAMSRHEDPGCELHPGNHYNWAKNKPTSYCHTYHKGYSHDAFIFKAPIENLRLDYLNFMPNHLGAENVVVFELLVAANLTVYNLCKRYHLMHVDCNRGLIQKGRVFTTAEHRVSVGPYLPANYQRFATAFPECRNTLIFKGFSPAIEREAGRAYFHERINGTNK